MTDLPKVLHESSGMEQLKQSNTFWMINDSGNKNELYEVKQNGKIARVIQVNNFENNDWEDLASDGESLLFIGDFGNNNNLRRDLSILWVDLNTSSGNNVIAQQTSFTLSDQKKFPPKKKFRNFDIEAFFYSKDYFYLITKNRGSQFDGVAKVYKLPAAVGEHEAKLIGSFKTCTDEKKKCWVTSADISEDGKEVSILTHNKIYKFIDFNDNYFFSGTVKMIDLEHNSQKEAICYNSENQLFLTDERAQKKGGNLYRVSQQN